jgi:hypothetical protein
MRVIVALGALVVALAVAPAASAGGFATVGFEPLPDGMSAGGTWNPTIFVKQHGITPLPGLHPTVEISDGSGAVETFAASETRETGVYEASVVFPSPGDWTVTIHSGFADSYTTYGPVAIGVPGGGGSPGELPVAGLGLVLLALAGCVVLLVAKRSRRLTPASG